MSEWTAADVASHDRWEALTGVIQTALNERLDTSGPQNVSAIAAHVAEAVEQFLDADQPLVGVDEDGYHEHTGDPCRTCTALLAGDHDDHLPGECDRCDYLMGLPPMDPASFLREVAAAESEGRTVRGVLRATDKP